MRFTCVGCGYSSEDENDFLAHLIECPSKPESKWNTYVGVMETSQTPFKNSEILEDN